MFARGWPGVGLLLLRLIAAVALMNQGWSHFHDESTNRSVTLTLLSFAVGLLLLGGLWTPVAGILVLAIESWAAFTKPGDHWNQILLGTLGAALALLGPGVWSIDARLFGWKRIGPRKG